MGNDNLVYLDRYIIAPALTIQQEPCDYSDLIYQGFCICKNKWRC